MSSSNLHDQLQIPFKITLRSNFIKTLSVTLFLLALFTAALFLPSEGDMKANIVKGIALLFDALLLYIFIFNEVLRKSYIEVTNESIKQGTPFGTKILGWYEVDDIDIISVNRQKSIALSRMQKPGKRRSFYREMDAALGGSYYINIPVNSLKGIDVDTLFTILRDKLLNAIRETETGRNDVIPPDELGSEEPVNSYSAAIIKSILSSLAVGILYGFSIALLKINIILIPFIGALYVGYVHDRNYKSERRSILRNFVLGISCSLQFPAAYVGIALIGILKEGELLLLPSVLSELAMLILRQPAKHAVMIFLFIGCILWMTFMDVSFRAQRQWKKLFMKRLDNYYYERRSHIYEIYLVDPADYDENREGNLIAAFGVGYLIERDGKKPGAFYIPKEGIEELGIILPEVIEVTIDNMVYLKLDLGGRGDIEPYAYKGALICNKDKEAQQLEIEYL